MVDDSLNHYNKILTQKELDMEKLKIFEGKISNLETDVNTWLSENPDIKIIERKFSTEVDQSFTSRFVYVAIFYTN